MSWTVDDMRKFNENVKKELESKYVKIPEGGSWTGILMLKEPVAEEKSWDGKSEPTKKYNFETVDGKILSASTKLTEVITSELLKLGEGLSKTNTDHVALEIHRKGTLKKPEWFVFIKGGV